MKLNISVEIDNDQIIDLATKLFEKYREIILTAPVQTAAIDAIQPIQEEKSETSTFKKRKIASSKNKKVRHTWDELSSSQDFINCIDMYKRKQLNADEAAELLDMSISAFKYWLTQYNKHTNTRNRSSKTKKSSNTSTDDDIVVVENPCNLKDLTEYKTVMDLDDYKMDGNFNLVKAYSACKCIKVLVIGGDYNFAKKLNDKFPTWTTVTSLSNRTYNVRSYDSVYFFDKAISHSLFHKYKAECEKYNVDFGYIKTVNINAVAKQVYIDAKSEGKLDNIITQAALL